MSEVIDNIEDDHQYSEIAHGYSNFDLTSNGSRANKDMIFNQTAAEIAKKKSPPRKSNVYTEKNKKVPETPVHIRLSKDASSAQKDLSNSALSAIKNAKFWH
jgi:hypothetical protein